MSQRLRWVLDVDVRKYFDSISHSHLRSFLDRRVTDGVIRRMIDKWLKAGSWKTVSCTARRLAPRKGA
jgi:retron-type reverse transcriptase